MFLTKVRKEIRLCDEIYDNLSKMKEAIKEVENKKRRKFKKKEEKKLKRRKKIEGMIGKKWYRNVSVFYIWNFWKKIVNWLRKKEFYDIV